MIFIPLLQIKTSPPGIIAADSEPTIEPISESVSEPVQDTGFVQPQFSETQQVQYNQYEDISSSNKPIYVKAASEPSQQSSNYEKYKAQFNVPQNYSAKSSSKKKK